MASDPNYEYGQWLSSPSPDDEIVISGLSGRLPESDNIYEFWDHLLKKEDMITGDGRRWMLDHHEIPKRTSKVKSIDKYDAGYFGVHYRQADIMDPMMRMSLECAVEAIMDAGLDPRDLEGTKTGVFVSSCWSDMEVNTLCGITEPQRFGVTGYFRSLISHRISYFLKLKGPAFNIDTACSSSINALNSAFKALRSGKCDSAIVGGVNLLLHPGVSLQFFRLGVLSKDGFCRVFDEDASGYVRGETVAYMFLQKAKNCKRIYARVINTKINGDGYKDEGITFPSPAAQNNLMTEIYNESGIAPSELSFLEAHGTGTQVGDPQEVEAIDCALAQKRTEPLLIGSVKSSIGHTEPVSGICAIIKVVLAMETGLIAPNINLKKIKKGMRGLEEGRMKVVTEIAKLAEQDSIFGVNNFGFGGNNGHTILKRNGKIRARREPKDDIPRLVCVSGRTKEAVQRVLSEINKSLDEEQVALLHQLYKKNILRFRGYTIMGKNGLLKTSQVAIVQPTPLYVFFGQFVKNFKVLGSDLLQYPTCKKTISRINQILQQKGSKILPEIFKGNVEPTYDVLGSISTQVVLVDLLKTLEIHPTAVYADSYAKLVSAYYHGLNTLEETISAALKISQLNYSADLHFQAEDKLRGDSLNLETFASSKKITILNISDSHINNKDVLLVDGESVKLLEALGRLFQQGHNPQIHELYPTVEFPVSRGTPMISPLLQWDHTKSWYIYKFSEFTLSDTEQREYSVSYLYDEFKFISGHVIDERNLFPAIEYLHLVWKTFAQSRRLLVEDVSVVFTNCRFIRAVTMPKTGFLALLITIQRGTGYFEIVEKNTVVVSGRIEMCNNSDAFSNLEKVELETDPRKIIEKDDIYREMYLRGYNYSGDFKGIEKCNDDGSSALVRWENNWTTFIDKLLQLNILSTDTRLLFVPVGIKKLIINPTKHIAMAEEIGGEEILFPAYNYKKCGIIRSGGVEISGLKAKSIVRRKPRLLPVLEKHVFVPNVGCLELQEAVRVNTQIILDENLETHFKAVEIIDENTIGEPLLPLVSQTLDDVPVVTPNLTISTKNEIKEIPGVKVEVVLLTPESKCLLIIGAKLIERLSSLKQVLVALKKNGFLLSREDVSFVSEVPADFEILTEYQTQNEKLILFRKRQKVDPPKIIAVTSNNFQWLPQLQKSMVYDSNIVLYAKNEEPEGLLGLVNCLRREPNGDKVRCVFIMDNTSKLTPGSSVLEEQLKKNFGINVFKENTWGTYRHLLLEAPKEVESEHYYADITTRGDISTLKWLQGPLTVDTLLGDEKLVMVYYSSVNFKDVMIASGRVGPEVISMERDEQECMLGFEFCGKTLDGRRVAGMTNTGSTSSYVACKEHTMWDVPPEVSLEEASTVTVVYATVLYALDMLGNLKTGDSILIHSGTGGIGLAAINVCLHYNCEIFVTVGTSEKREYLRKNYPQIPESHIGNSRDTSFEEMVKSQTKCRGVDFVLNSLADDKLKASVRCLAPGGRFLEIGKFDLGNDTELEMLLLEKRASFHGVMLDRIFINNRSMHGEIIKKIKDGLKAGFVKPLPRKVFEKEELQASYRYMMTGKHIGKVLVKLCDEEKHFASPKVQKHKAVPRYHCNSLCSYIIIGGLGGIGLELADWLFLRGAKKIILVSRTGLQTGYQSQRIKTWSSYGVQVHISTKNVTTKKGCVELIKDAQKLGPVDAIFNLAVVLKDALIEDQSEEKFVASLAPKAQATIYLDQATRELCPEMRSFVVFSSVSCGRGNVGQTNYGMANSVMERICEKRKSDGLAALAIQWGAVGEVGLVAKMQKVNKELIIGGTLQQKVSSCFEALDRFLNQESPIVSSMVVAEKHIKNYGVLSAVEAVAHILGIPDLKTVSQHRTLPELGMDSMMGTEVIQLLEKDYEIYITPKDMKSLTIAKLAELEAEKKNATEDQKAVKAIRGVELLLRSIPEKNIRQLNFITLKENKDGPYVFLFPGIDASFHHFEKMLQGVEGNIIGVQYKYNDPEDTIAEMAQNIVPHIENKLSKESPIYMVGYSYGVAVTLEVAKLLENSYTFKLILIDGSPTYLSSSATDSIPETEENEFQTAVLFKLLSVFLPVELLLQYKDKLLKCANYQERIELSLALIPPDIDKSKLDTQGAKTMYKRFKSIINYVFGDGKIKSEVFLFKAQFPMVKEEEDYQLSKFCDRLVKVVTINGDHATILDQPELTEGVNVILCNTS